MKFSKDDTLAIKGIAILLMFFHHNFLKMERFEIYTINPAPFSPETIVYFAQFCKICVGMFVFLSAYGMTLSFKKKREDYLLDRKDTVELTISRYLKLMFGYWFIFILVQVFSTFYDAQRIISKYGEVNTVSFWGKWLLDMLGLSDLFGSVKYIPTWWYMGLAIVMIFLMPILLRGYNMLGGLLVPLSVLVPRALGLEQTKLVRWLLCIVLGIWFADKNILVKVKEWKLVKNSAWNNGIKFVIGTIGLCMCVVLRQSEWGNEFLDVFDGIVPAYVICYSFMFLSGIKYLNKGLMFLGKHSMNMFLTHTFIRAVWWDEFLYSFEYVWLIMLVLTILSLVLSIVIEWLKKILHYNIWSGKMTGKLVGWIKEIA